MKASESLRRLFLLSVVLMVGCSGEQQSSEQQNTQAQQVKVNEAKMYGAWQSEDKSFGFEFHASPIKVATVLTDITLNEVNFQPEGIIYAQGKLSAYFIWSLMANGMLRLDVKAPSCQARPLTLCATDSVQMIEVLGSNVSNLTFKISEDKDLDGKVDDNFDWRLSKKPLPAISVGDRAFLIEAQNRADSQFLVSSKNGVLEINVPKINGDHKFVEASRDQYSITLIAAQEIRTTEQFYVYNHGELDVSVRHDYEYFRLYPAFDDHLIVSYKIDRALELNGDLSTNDVDLNDYLMNVKRSKKVDLVSAGNFAPHIEYGRPYYSIFWEVFDNEEIDNGSGNQIIFLDDTKAKIISGNVLGETPLAEQIVDWRKGIHDGEIILESPRVIVHLEFLSGDHDRYRVVISTYNKQDNEHPVRYASDYFFAQNDDIDLSLLSPLEFEFIHVDGVIVSPVRLLDDGEVELVNVDDVEGGRWFFNGTNELVRFECLNTAEVAITDYQECLDSFEYVATPQTKTTYSHISKLKFINKVGDNYLVQYDAAFWGGRWGREDYIRRFSVYYQWIHLAK